MKTTLVLDIVSKPHVVFMWLLIGYQHSRIKQNKLRLLPTFEGALREKIARAPVSIKSHVLYEKDTISVMFSFSMCQEVVRRETTECSCIEFIGFRIPQEQNGRTVLFTRHQSKNVCRIF